MLDVEAGKTWQCICSLLARVTLRLLKLVKAKLVATHFQKKQPGRLLERHLIYLPGQTVVAPTIHIVDSWCHYHHMQDSLSTYTAVHVYMNVIFSIHH